MRFLAFLALVTAVSLAAQTAFVTGSGYSTPPAITVAPGQIATFYVGGLSSPSGTTTIAQLTNGSAIESVSVVSVKPVSGAMAAVTVLIPFDVVPGSGLPLTLQFGQLTLAQGVPGQNSLPGDLCAQNLCTVPVALTAVSTLPHIINTCDFLYSASTNPCQLAITHQNGSLVTNSAPANGGEILTIWALGLGVPASGIPAAGSGPIAMNDIMLNTFFSATAPNPSGSAAPSTPYLWAGLTSPTSGLYQINFAVPQPPANLQPCTQSSEWFVGSGGNFEVSVFRLVPFASPSALTGFFYSIAEFQLPTGNAPAICVAI